MPSRICAPPDQLLSAYFMDSAFYRQPWFLCFFGFQGCCSSQQHPDPSLASQSAPPPGPLECGPSLLSDLRTYYFPSCCYSLSTLLAFLKHSKLIPASGLLNTGCSLYLVCSSLPLSQMTHFFPSDLPSPRGLF